MGSDSGFVIIAGVPLLSASVFANSLFNHFGSIPEILSLHGSSPLKEFLYDCSSCISPDEHSSAPCATGVRVVAKVVRPRRPRSVGQPLTPFKQLGRGRAPRAK